MPTAWVPWRNRKASGRDGRRTIPGAGHLASTTGWAGHGVALVPFTDAVECCHHRGLPWPGPASALQPFIAPSIARPVSLPSSAVSIPLQRALTQGAPAPRLYPGWATFLLSVLAGPTAALVATWLTLHRLRRIRTELGLLAWGLLCAIAQQALVVWVVLDPEALRHLADALPSGRLRSLLTLSQHLLGGLVWLATATRLHPDLKLAETAGMRVTSPWRMSLLAFALALAIQVSVGTLAALAR